MRVLVTGGTGFLGKRLKKIKPTWLYIGKKDCNLTNKDECKKILEFYKPDAIIHLAGQVGGIKENTSKQAEFYYNNIYINTNVIHSSYELGIKRVLATLSTCAFPNVVKKYPFNENDIFSGPPAETNFSYSFTKRAMYVQILSYRKQFNLNYSCFCPSNLYGPEANFNENSSHFIQSLVHKVHKAKDGDCLDFWGTGAPLRQNLYVDDMAKIIPILLDRHNTKLPIIVAPNKNTSIKDTIDLLLSISGKNIEYKFNGLLDGQYRKDGNNKSLLKILGEFKFTTLEEGITHTYNWYKNL